MNPTEADQILIRFEDNLFHDLYRSRWDSAYAAGVVPLLRQCLEVDDATLLLRTLSALHRIGPEAHEAAYDVIRLLIHEKLMVREAAVTALGGICYRNPSTAIQSLLVAAQEAALLKPVMFVLIDFGRAAKSTTPLFLSVFASRDWRMRRLAIRGLGEIDADFEEAFTVLAKAMNDKSAEVRRYTEKLLKRKWPMKFKEIPR